MTRVSGTDVWIQSKQWFTVVGGDLPCIVQLLIEFDGETANCTQILFAAHRTVERVSSTMIRQVPIDELFRAASSDLMEFYERGDDGVFTPTSFFPDRQALQHAQGVRRRTPVEELEAAAAIYLHAVAAGQHPTAAVERELGLPNRNTAKKRVQQARIAGFLGAAVGERRSGARIGNAARRSSRKRAGE